MTWQPEEGTLRQLAGFLNDTLNAYDQSVRKHAEQMLAQATSSPDFVNYLSFLISTTPPPANMDFTEQAYDVIRVSAALNLKTKLRLAYHTVTPESLAYLHSAVLIALQDPKPIVSSSAGSIMAELVKQGGFLRSPNLLEELVSLIDNNSGSVSLRTQESAISALQKICEDNRPLLEREFQGQRPINAILPKLMEFTASQHASIRTMALSTVQMFLSHKSSALMGSLDSFLHHLFKLADDPNTDVRKIVCQSFVQLAEMAPEKLVPHTEGLVNYILLQEHNAEDPELVLEASEFWLVVGDQRLFREPLVPFLPRIVPVLLQNMVYNEDEAALIAGEADNADEEDRIEDLRPQFSKSKGSRLGGGKDLTGNKAGQRIDSDDDDLSDGEIEEDGDPEEEWTIRKSSATALDIFATVYHDTIFEIVLPYLREHLKNASWTHREAAVLALGAIADGCMASVIPHLPELVPYLISLLSDPEPIVKLITCWCLGRYSGWAAHLKQPELSLYFEPMMEGILQRMLDNNKKVQEAAASGFRSLEERSGPNLIPYCEPILRQFVLCFDKYKDRNLDVLYDCVQTFAESVGSELTKPELTSILMPALIGRWNKLSDQSRELFPLLECLSFIAVAYGPAFSPFAAPIFNRSTKIVYDIILASNNAARDPDMAEPNKDFLVTALDLLGSIIQALEPQDAAELVLNTQPQFFELLSYCLQDQNHEIALSAYALLGDCATHVFSSLQPFLPTIMPILVKQLDLDSIRDDTSESGLSVVNNACWACGEISVQAKSSLAPFADGLYQAFITILSNEEIPESVNENAAIALGRLGLCTAEQMAPHLADFARPFLLSMAGIDCMQEKASAFIGFNQIIRQNPKALEACLADYFREVAVISEMKSLSGAEYDELQQSCRQVLHGYKELIPGFDAFVGSLPSNIAWKLKSIYQL